MPQWSVFHKFTKVLIVAIRSPFLPSLRGARGARVYLWKAIRTKTHFAGIQSPGYKFRARESGREISARTTPLWELDQCIAGLTQTDYTSLTKC